MTHIKLLVSSRTGEDSYLCLRHNERYYAEQIGTDNPAPVALSFLICVNYRMASVAQLTSLHPSIALSNFIRDFLPSEIIDQLSASFQDRFLYIRWKKDKESL